MILFQEEGKKIEVDAGYVEEKVCEDVLMSAVNITVSDPEKKIKQSGLKLQETYVSYLIETVPKSTSSTFELSSAWRRYSEFELLRNYLIAMYPAVVVPPIPEKRANYVWRKLASVEAVDLDFLERRRGGLESFLHRVASHQKMGKDDIVRRFVTKEEGFKEAVVETGYQAKMDSWIKNTNASFRVKQPDIRLEKLKNYANHLQAATGNLLKMRAKVAERIYGIYKVHGNYSRVLKEWALIEKNTMKTSLQAASIEMETFAKSIDTLIDEEDQLAEQIKEYMYFADSLKLVCQKHQAVQYEVEQCEYQLSLALHEQKQLQEQSDTTVKSTFSFVGMKARLLGIDQTVQREGRLEQLEIDIAVFEGELEKSRNRAEDFLEEAVKEMEIFRKRKVSDLREVFTSYAVLQIKLHREGIEIWSRFKKPLAAMISSQKEVSSSAVAATD